MGKCVDHMPETPLPRVVSCPNQRYDVGVFCTCLQRWNWVSIEAKSFRSAMIKAKPIIVQLRKESADRWGDVIRQAKNAAGEQRRLALSRRVKVQKV